MKSGSVSLSDFIVAFSSLLNRTSEEATILAEGSKLLAGLIAHDDWLPESYGTISAGRYDQHLLYRDAKGRFSVVSFAWGAGEGTPIHDHRVWGLVGILRGCETVQRFGRTADGGIIPEASPYNLSVGQIESISIDGDIHRVSNAFDDRISVSIHVYGADISNLERSMFTDDGREQPYVSRLSDRPALIQCAEIENAVAPYPGSDNIHDISSSV